MVPINLFVTRDVLQEECNANTQGRRRRVSKGKAHFQYFVFFVFILLVSASWALAQVPAPPTGSKVLSRVEEASDWQTCGSCGNTGGTGKVATYSMERGITSPNVDGSASKFSIGGTYPYANAYWFIKRYSNVPSTPLSYLKYEFYVYVPSGYENTPQGIEFECQQKVGGKAYNFAWQADYAQHQWRTYNIVYHRWENSGIGFSGLTAGKWHHIVAEYHVASGQSVHDALTVDGVRHVVSIHHGGASASSGTYLSNAFQLDLNSSATDFHVYVDAMSVTYK